MDVVGYSLIVYGLLLAFIAYAAHQANRRMR